MPHRYTRLLLLTALIVLAAFAAMPQPREAAAAPHQPSTPAVAAPQSPANPPPLSTAHRPVDRSADSYQASARPGAPPASYTRPTLAESLPTEERIISDVDYAISGTVYQENGTTPINGADVYLLTTGGAMVDGTLTDVNGDWDFPTVPEGDYKLQFFASGRAMQFYGGGQNGDSATPINVTGPLTDLDVNLNPGGTISGTVVDEDTNLPLANVNVFTDNVWLGACTDANGDYTIYGYELDVAYTLMAGGPYNNCASGPVNYLAEWFYEDPFYQNAAPLTPTTGTPNLTSIGFTLEAGNIISGTVYEDDATTPLQDATIAARPIYGGQEYLTTTDANGSYTLYVDDNTYRVEANAAGWAFEFYDDAGQNGDDATPVALNNSDSTDVDFVLGPEGTISGTVYEVDGTTPIPNVFVAVEGAWLGDCTDANGDYYIPQVAQGVDYKLVAGPSWETICQGDTFQYLPEWWEESDNYFDAATINIDSGTPNLTDYDFTLDQGSEITGTVYEADGTTPIPNAWVWVEGWSNFAYMGGDNADINGDYRILVPDGSYRIRAEADTYAFEYWDGAGQHGFAATTLVVSGDASDIDFTLNPGGSISGTLVDEITGDPIPYMAVSTDYEWQSACTDANGEYTISGLELDVDYLIYSGGPYNWCGGSTTYLSEYYTEAYSWVDATPISVTTGTPDVTGIDWNLGIGNLIEGTVTEADNTTPIAGAWVDFYDFESRIYLGGVYTDLDGDYSFYLPDGDYLVEAGADGFAFEFYGTSSQDGNLAPAFTLTGNYSGLDFSLDPGGSISGTVIDEDTSDPLAYLPVFISGVWAATCTDVDGTYTIDDLRLDTEVIVAASDVENWCGGDYGYPIEYYNDTYYLSQADPVEPTTGTPDVTGIDFALEVGNLIEGTIFEVDGVTAIDGSRVDVYNYATGEWLVGQYPCYCGLFGLYVPDGSYRIAASADGYQWEFYNEAGQNGDAVSPVTLNGFDISGVDFTLTLEGTISGTVTDADTGAPLENIWVWANDTWIGDCTDANGDYYINELERGITYNVQAASTYRPECETLDTDYWPRWHGDTPDLATAQDLVVDDTTPDHTDIDIEVVNKRNGAPADANGDGVSEVTVFRNGAWHSYDYATGSLLGSVWTGQGSPTARAVMMDYDGDGADEFTIYNAGAWHFFNADGSYHKGLWVAFVALPVPADYDGDGDEDVVLWDNGAWHRFNFTTGAYEGGVWTGGEGAGAVPAPMDYDGDGTADFTVYNGGAWHFFNDNGTYNKGIWVAFLGAIPVPGDYNGDNTDDVVLWQEDSGGGAWHWFDFATGNYVPANSVYTAAAAHKYALARMPAPVNYDGDDDTDYSVYLGGPWNFFAYDGSFVKNIPTGGVAGDKDMSGRPPLP